jgi:hypothetical protein
LTATCLITGFCSNFSVAGLKIQRWRCHRFFQKKISLYLMSRLQVARVSVIIGTILVETSKTGKIRVEKVPGRKASEVTAFTSAAVVN